MATTLKSKLKANAKYEKKLTRKNVIFKQEEDKELLNAIDQDNEPFSSLVKRLLSEHYKI